MLKIQDTVIICPPVIAQYAAAGALRQGSTFFIEKVRAITETRAMVQCQLWILENAGLAEVPPASGALYFLLRLRSRLTPLTYATRLIREHGVAVIHGDAFGLTEGCHLRIAYGALQPATVAEGIGRLVAGVQALRD
jgi:aspartate/methionine/tyrosine aminotransferase